MNTSLDMMVSQIELTPASLETFTLYANDAANWCGSPWVSEGNVWPTKAMRGNLSDLVKKGLIEIHDYDEGDKVIWFTESGRALAESLEINLDMWDFRKN